MKKTGEMVRDSFMLSFIFLSKVREGQVDKERRMIAMEVNLGKDMDINTKDLIYEYMDLTEQWREALELMEKFNSNYSGIVIVKENDVLKYKLLKADSLDKVEDYYNKYTINRCLFVSKETINGPIKDILDGKVGNLYKDGRNSKKPITIYKR
nr:MAG TPA: hypothetical protein [Caudoviricetes sp.]